MNINHIAEINDGAAVKEINLAIQKLLNNMNDETLPWKRQRSLKIELTFELMNGERTHIQGRMEFKGAMPLANTVPFWLAFQRTKDQAPSVKTVSKKSAEDGAKVDPAQTDAFAVKENAKKGGKK